MMRYLPKNAGALGMIASSSTWKECVGQLLMLPEPRTSQRSYGS
jgi:hypothetical protein